MKTNDSHFELIRRCCDGGASTQDLAQLEVSLCKDVEFREAYVRYANLDVALSNWAKLDPLSKALQKAPQRGIWRPITAAAAGLVFGMFCTSMVFGFVSQRADAVNSVPLSVFDAGLEDEKQILKDGLPVLAGQWGMDAASIVPSEGQVRPLQGKRMMRLEPIPHEKPVKNHTSRVYQVLNLNSQRLAMINGEAEAEVTASFCAAKSDFSSRYLIRAIALDEEPEVAIKNFWSKVESDGVVSESQRFDTVPEDAGWHTFSMKLRLPPESKTLVLIFGAVPPVDASLPALVHYLDNVQVTLCTTQSLP
jgi:hypothetical protein